MHLSWLEDFRCLAENGNFSQSAKERNTSQPALSRRIFAIEKWVGTALIDHSSHPVTLTESGKVFLATVDEVSQTIASGLAYARQTAEKRHQPVTMVATHMIAHHFFPEWVERLDSELEKTLSQRLLCFPITQCFIELQNHHADFALCPVPHNCSGLDQSWHQFQYVNIGHDVLIPVSAPGEDGLPIYSLTSTKAEPLYLLSLSEGSVLGDSVRHLLSEKSKTSSIQFITAFESSLKETVKAMVLRGKGLAWLPRAMITAELNSGSLIIAGDSSWFSQFDIRCYYNDKTCHPDAKRIWNSLLKSN